MPVRFLIDDAKKSDIIAAYVADCSFAKMAERFGMCSPSIRKYLKEWGIYGKKTRHGLRRSGKIDFSEEETAIIFEMYKRGDNIPKIARHVCVRPITLSAFLKGQGMFQARRNKDYKLGITDDKIKEVFDKTGSIRATSRQLGGINTRFVKAALLRLEVKDPTHHEIYARIEGHKTEIIALYQRSDVPIPDICVKFDISKHILRSILKKWGVYDVKKHPSLALVKAGVSKETIIDTYSQLRNISATGERLGLSASMISKVLKNAKVSVYFIEKSELLEKSKESIIHRYSVVREPCKVIAADYEVWVTTIYDSLKRWGVKTDNHKNKITQEKLETNRARICDLYENRSYALREIAEEVGVSHTSLIRAVKRWGLIVPDNRFKESSLERKFKKILTEQSIAFTQFKQVGNRIYDFYLPKFNLIVECNGDYWHGHPRIFPKPNVEQIKGRKRDLCKSELAKKAGYAIYFIWESEVNASQYLVVTLLLRLIAGEAPMQQSSPMDFLTERPEIVNLSPVAA
jgi:transposase-like protein